MKRSLVLLCIVWLFQPAHADEGMWIPILLHRNLERMQELGLKLTAEDIYSVNKACLKDAIVHFGSGCTGVIVSDQGLILTNHHCGFGSIQRNSTLEHDYLTNGFWASSLKEELPNKDLTVTRLVRMEDVTSAVLSGIPDNLPEASRNRLIRQRTDSLEKESVKGTWYQARIRPFYYGNQYFLFIQEVFQDVRLVGAPPSSIGNFGGDTDNWAWPRHTGDFSVFRIYADSANRPAPYSAQNIPYRPLYVAPVSSSGIEEGDFTMVFGFPGMTREYLTSYGVELQAMKENPVRIHLREQKLRIMKSYMESDRLINIQYATKRSRIANGWKKMIGETRGISRLDGVRLKIEQEKVFQESDRTNLLQSFQKVYEGYNPYALAGTWMTEGPMTIELVQFAARFKEIMDLSEAEEKSEIKWKEARNKLLQAAKSFYKEYQPGIDLEVARAMLTSAMKGMDERFYPQVFQEIRSKYSGSVQAYTKILFETSMLTDSLATYSWINNLHPKSAGKIVRDPAIRLQKDLATVYSKKIGPLYRQYQNEIDSLQRIYMGRMMKYQPNRLFYPDANGTLRISYGVVQGYTPADAIMYRYYTTLDGVIQKYDTTVADYRLDPGLRKLYEDKDFGKYADKEGRLRIAFLASNHTSGGNSGSPVFNGKGELVGLNFDRVWEGTMSDLMYDPDQCRNITLDIRYCLFVIDKYAGAENLIREMNGISRKD